ncbi:hypothetical protein G6F59_018249 [Rhizopus arrhizus]|nr:hypothetical protein G6F59_018249 [Rhizopus arrhizus]
MRLFSRLRLTSALATTALAAAVMASPAHAQTAAAAQGSASRTVLVVGDSLSAEYGLKRGTGWVPLLSARVSEQYPKYQVVTASRGGGWNWGRTTRCAACRWP